MQGAARRRVSTSVRTSLAQSKKLQRASSDGAASTKRLRVLMREAMVECTQPMEPPTVLAMAVAAKL
jgi:hypothetical protein